MFENPEIKSINVILRLKNLKLPNYQRPYKWSVKNVCALLADIEFAIHQSDKYTDFKYRIGTIILHNDEDADALNIVDGQQRIVTLALICKVLGQSAEMPILKTEIAAKISEENIKRNFLTIKAHFANVNSNLKKRYMEAMSDVLEFVVVSTKHLAEAFQLFDSQNTRGRALAPHDLLKAFHLREMRSHPNEMKHTVEKWERINPKEIHTLFRDYLFPIKCWVDRYKGHKFTSADIDEYKGISFDLQYNYAMRTVKGMPIFQIDQPFVSGKNFFEYVEHYINLLSDVKDAVSRIGSDLFLGGTGVGFSYAQQLFFCAVLYYCDRFRNFDDRVIKRLYAWAFMIRLRMQKLGFDTVKNYAVGQDENLTSIPMFYLLHKCMNESDVLKSRIPMLPEEEIKYSPKNNDKDSVFISIQNALGYWEELNNEG